MYKRQLQGLVGPCQIVHGIAVVVFFIHAYDLGQIGHSLLVVFRVVGRGTSVIQVLHIIRMETSIHLIVDRPGVVRQIVCIHIVQYLSLIHIWGGAGGAGVGL